MEFLSREGVSFTARDVREDGGAMLEVMNMGFQSTPVIVVDGAPHVGFDPAALRAALA